VDIFNRGEIEMKSMRFLLPLLTALAITFSLTTLAHAQTITTLASFDGASYEFPTSPLVQGTNGNFYGLTTGCENTCHKIFEITPAGKMATFYTFCSLANCADGDVPAGLMLASNGNFYGTTTYGGTTTANCGGEHPGCGTVFEITPAGKLTTLHSFCSLPKCADGVEPTAGLVQAGDGDLYGTAANTFFKITLDGKLTALHTFTFGSGTGALPFQQLVQAENGNFYGSTSRGAGRAHYGTLFEITPSGTVSTLYDLCSSVSCVQFPSALIQGADGNLYGTSEFAGAHDGGTVFQMTPSGGVTILYSFCTNVVCPHGYRPWAALVQATDGNFYGTTVDGGANKLSDLCNALSVCGTLFEITPTAEVTTLHSFCVETNCADGQGPIGGLIQGTDGSFYGTTVYGGVHSSGTVFNLSVGLGRFVKTVPVAAKPGKRVIILGNGLTGSTSVTFNGTAATFTVVSDTEITATVPTGATTGTVAVTTPTGTIISNPAFQVLK
jgi:uncharacterized repeat protein (TIGR03803 family)